MGTKHFQFVEDLIPLILESNEHWWAKDLARLALVSPGWLYYVQKRLYISPSLHSFSACASLAGTLESSPYLTSLVKHLTLCPTQDHTSPKCSSRGRVAVGSLLGLEGLESLVIGGELSIHSERFLGFVSASDTLTALHIDGSYLRESLSCSPSLEWDEDLILKFPHIKRLRLTDIELDITPMFVPQPLEMDELVLEGVCIISGFLSYVVCKGSTLKRLCIKTSSACEYDEHIRLILYTSKIQTLVYEVQKASGSDCSFLEANGAGEGQALWVRDVELHGHRIDRGLLDSMAERCPNIEMLTISGRMMGVTPEEWQTYIGSRRMTRLQRLVLSFGTNEPPYRGWSSSVARRVWVAGREAKVEVVGY